MKTLPQASGRDSQRLQNLKTTGDEANQRTARGTGPRWVLEVVPHFSRTLSLLTFDDDADKGERRGAKTKPEQELKES
jgi:hypothetical protein